MRSNRLGFGSRRILKDLAQLLQGGAHLRFDRADRDLTQAGDFLVGAIGVLSQQEDVAFFGPETAKRGAQAFQRFLMDEIIARGRRRTFEEGFETEQRTRPLTPDIAPEITAAV